MNRRTFVKWMTSLASLPLLSRLPWQTAKIESNAYLVPDNLQTGAWGKRRLLTSYEGPLYRIRLGDGSERDVYEQDLADLSLDGANVVTFYNQGA